MPRTWRSAPVNFVAGPAKLFLVSSSIICILGYMSQTASSKHSRLPEIPEAFALSTLAVAAREPARSDKKAITKARRSVARLLLRGEL